MQASRVSPVLGVALVLAWAGAGCERGPSETELDEWLAEARAAEAAAQASHIVEDETEGWTLTILGEHVASPTVLPYRALETASTVTILATPPLAGATQDTYRGARIDTLVSEALGTAPPPEEVTLIASDGFRATVAWSDLRRAPILLATWANGARLSRERGGPLLAVFPLDDVPDLRDRYTESWWVYYVTHLVAGTPSPELEVNGRRFGAAALDALPSAVLSASVGYRVGWPSEPVRLSGPSLLSLLTAAGVEVTAATRVRVMSVAPISRGPTRPTIIDGTDVLAERVIVARTHGENDAPIPARLGGPLVLALSDEVAAHHPDHDWLTFVTEVRLEPTGTP